MKSEYLLLLSLIVLGFCLFFYFLNRKFSQMSSKDKESETLVKWLQSMQQSLDTVTKTFNDSLQKTNQNITSTLQTNTKSLNDRLDKAAQIIGAVGKEVGQMAEIGRSMKDLQDFLRSPKLRGNIGEQILKDLLTQMIPKQSFHLQYAFRSGETVDAAITTDSGIIPIDSKFPMENFKKMMGAENDNEKQTFQKEFTKDVKKHIDSIAKKYILTDEGTIDYALMYIPSESIYYQIISDTPQLVDYAHEKRVLPVSPTTFYAYLRTILVSFEGNKIAKEAKEILRALKAIQTDAGKFNDSLGTLNRHVNNTYNSMSQVMGGFTHLTQKIHSVGQLTDSIDQQPKLVLEEK